MSQRAVYIEWGAHRRSVQVAEAFGAELITLRWHTSSRLATVVRYGVQFVQTLARLARARPHVVFSLHTQPFCSAAALIYCTVRGAVLVTDCHDGAFLQERWHRFPVGPLNRAVLRRSRLNLVHNDQVVRHAVDAMGLPGRFEVLHDGVPPSACSPTRLSESATAVFMCSLAEDEPIEVIVAAARLLPDVECMVTGRADGDMVERLGDLPPNLTLTGYLAWDDFDALVCAATVAVVLTTRTNVTRACLEAMAAGRPLVSSDNEAARGYMTSGTVFVDNTAVGVAAGIREALQRERALAGEMAALAPVKDAQWRVRVAELRGDIGLVPWAEAGDDAGCRRSVGNASAGATAVARGATPRR